MSDIINAEMITLARELRGYSQIRLARLSGVSQAQISKVEAHLVDASPEVVSALAQALGMPDRFFYQTDPIHGAGVSEFFHRKRKNAPAGVLKQVHAWVNILRIHVTRLLRAVEFPACNIPSLELEEFEGNPSKAARAVRAALNIATGPIPNVVHVIEQAGGLVIPAAFGTYEIDAISRYVPGLPPLFFINSSAPVDRFRMSLAHELAHVVLHRIPENDMEQQANVFASEFLMPATDIKNQLYGLTLNRLAALKPYWRTSMAALLMRATELQCITPGSSRYLWMHMSSRGYRKREPAELDLAPESPSLLREILDFYRNELGYSLSDLAKTLVVSMDDLMAWYPVALTRAETVRQFRRVK
jgi:Zn-dependent peptidase ImmA (M78 family)